MDRDSNSFGGGGERISTNFEAVRTGLRLFDISNVPLLISYASTNINLSFESENQASLSLSLSPLLSLAFDEGNKAKFVILHGIIRTREPLRPIHTIHYTRQGYLLRGCSFAYEAHPSPFPSFPCSRTRVVSTGMTPESRRRISLEPRIARKFNVPRAL